MSTLISFAKTMGNKNLLIHTLFLIGALSYIFYLMPNWYSGNRFHIWAPVILAGIDVFTFYFFLVLITYFHKAKIPVVILGLISAGIFLYYSGGLNYERTLSLVLKVSEVPIWFNKPFIIAAIPRLGLVLFASVTYYAFLNLNVVTALIKKNINLEFLVNLFLVLFLIVYRLPPVSDSDLVEVLVIKLTLITLFYSHAFLISPILFKQKKYKKYLLWELTSIIVTTGIFFAIIFFIDDFSGIRKDILRFTLQVLVVTSIIGSVGLVYGFARHKIISRVQKTQTALGNTTSELLLLKSQVNPHFLFNTLNTLYATALEENATVTASATAKLANLVRYMQQDMQQEFIPLDREAGYVSDYINIQKLRIGSPLEVSTTFENLEEIQISPGLLIPFVENAFKYGIDPDKTSRIDIKLQVLQNTIYFSCENEYSQNYTTYYREKGFGIGIKNTRERLDLIYPKKYQLDVEKTDHLFTVTLKINTL